MAIHVTIVVRVAPGIIKAIDKVRWSFFWSSTESTSGGQCRVAWRAVTRPLELGGLGVLDLTMLGCALRLRWEWLTCTYPNRFSTVVTSKPEWIVRAMFEASTSVQVDNGRHALF
jgi:hypothetical protein